MPVVDLVPRKLPKQGRSRATVDAILDACGQILLQTGYDAATTNRISERAGVSIGTLYEYFTNKEAIAASLAIRTFRRVVTAHQTALAEAAPMSDLGGLEHLIWAGVRAIRDGESVFRVLMPQAPYVLALPEVAEARAALDDIAGEARKQSKSPVAMPMPEIDTWLIARMLNGATIEIALLDVPEERRALLVRELARLTFRMAMARDPGDDC